MTDELVTFSMAELMADVVKIQRTGVPCGLSGQRIEPGFVLANGTVLLESEKDEEGRYIGGGGMGGGDFRAKKRDEAVVEGGGAPPAPQYCSGGGRPPPPRPLSPAPAAL